MGRINEYDSALTYYRIASMSSRFGLYCSIWVSKSTAYSSLGKDNCSFYSALAANEHLVNELEKKSKELRAGRKYEKKAKLEMS